MTSAAGAGRADSTWSRTFRSFQSRNFRLYYLGLFVSNIGTWLQAVAQSWLIYRLTDSGWVLGTLAAAQWGPMLVLGAWGGALADRYDKRRVMMATQAISAIQALVLAAAVGGHWANVWLVHALALSLGLVNAIDNPARRGFIPQLVGEGEASNAMALNTAVMTSTRIIGPALAGTLIKSVGVAWCFLGNGLSFLAVIAAVAALDTTTLRPAQRARRAPGQVREGLRYAWNDPVLRTSLLATAVIGTLAYNYQITLLLLAERTFGGDAGTFGTLLAVTSVGSLIGALITAGRAHASPFYLLGAAAVFGVAMGAVATAPSLLVACGLAIPMGAAGSAFVSTGGGLLQQRGRSDMRGRLMALHSVVFLGSTPIGGPIVGVVGDRLGPRAALYLGAATALTVAAVAFVFKRESFDSPTNPGVAPHTASA